MRKTFTLIILIAFAISGYSQDYLKLKNGEKKTVIVLEVTPENIKYKNFDNQNGPTYTIQKSEAISILYQNGKEEKLNSAFEEKKLEYVKGGTVQLDGVELSKVELKKLFEGTDAMKYYKKSNQGKIFAYTFAPLGGVLLGGGIALLAFGDGSNTDATALIAMGAALSTVGFVMISGINNNLKKAVNVYNHSLKNKSVVSVDFGLTSNGVGFIVKF